MRWAGRVAVAMICLDILIFQGPTMVRNGAARKPGFRRFRKGTLLLT
jgi:hypothetical protein